MGVLEFIVSVIYRILYVFLVSYWHVYSKFVTEYKIPALAKHVMSEGWSPW